LTGVILQPSYIPWRGYFDLIHRADVFVFYDDVQYDKHGWRNRNRIAVGDHSEWLTIPVRSKGNVTNRLRICDTEVHWERAWNRAHLDKVSANYRRAPGFKRYFPLLEEHLSVRRDLLVEYTIPLTRAICDALGICDTRFLLSSELDIHDDDPTGRLVKILQHLGATTYVSGPSAKAYLREDAFAEAGISLEYIEYSYPNYTQTNASFDGSLSIMDLLFMEGERASEFIWNAGSK
jgi:hypothetical protein